MPAFETLCVLGFGVALAGPKHMPAVARTVGRALGRGTAFLNQGRQFVVRMASKGDAKEFGDEIAASWHKLQRIRREVKGAAKLASQDTLTRASTHSPAAIIGEALPETAALLSQFGVPVASTPKSSPKPASAGAAASPLPTTTAPPQAVPSVKHGGRGPQPAPGVATAPEPTADLPQIPLGIFSPAHTDKMASGADVIAEALVASSFLRSGRNQTTQEPWKVKE